MKYYPMKLRLMVVAATILIVSCGKSPTDESEFENDVLASRTVDGWLLEATITKPVYSRGDTVDFSFTITNNRKENRGGGCPSLCKFFWNVYRDDRIIYSLEHHIGCADMLSGWSLAPGESRTYHAQWGGWPQTDDDGNKVAPGEYQLELYLCGFAHTIKKSFEIQ